jgi:hypothetical protein
VQLCTRNDDDFTIKMLIICFIWRFQISLQYNIQMISIIGFSG